MPSAHLPCQLRRLQPGGEGAGALGGGRASFLKLLNQLLRMLLHSLGCSCRCSILMGRLLVWHWVIFVLVCICICTVHISIATSCWFTHTFTCNLTAGNGVMMGAAGCRNNLVAPPAVHCLHTCTSATPKSHLAAPCWAPAF